MKFKPQSGYWDSGENGLFPKPVTDTSEFTQTSMSHYATDSSVALKIPQVGREGFWRVG